MSRWTQNDRADRACSCAWPWVPFVSDQRTTVATARHLRFRCVYGRGHSCLPPSRRSSCLAPAHRSTRHRVRGTQAHRWRGCSHTRATGPPVRLSSPARNAMCSASSGLQKERIFESAVVPKPLRRRRARTLVETGRRGLPAIRRVPDQDHATNSGLHRRVVAAARARTVASARPAALRHQDRPGRRKTPSRRFECWSLPIHRSPWVCDETKSRGSRCVFPTPSRRH
jgi:hypothetical protein